MIKRRLPMIKKNWNLINFIDLKAKLSRILRSIIDQIIDLISNIDMNIMDIRREDNLWPGFAVILLCLILIAGCGQGQSKVASQDEAKGLVMSKTDEQPSVKRKVIEPTATTTLAIDPNIAKKLDPALKRKLAELAAQDRMDEEIGMIGKYAGVEPQELRQKVSELGCSVGTVTVSLFTVECQARDVFELAKFEFVKYLELEKEVYPLKQNNLGGGGKCGE